MVEGDKQRVTHCQFPYLAASKLVEFILVDHNVLSNLHRGQHTQFDVE